jgi:Mannosyltransferase (PIG-V)
MSGPGTSHGGGLLERLRASEGLLPCLWAFLALRVGVSLLCVIAVGLVDVRAGIPSVPGWPADPVMPGWHDLVTGLVRQDALWFLRIATEGYRVDDASAAFFPLYPLLTRILSWLTGGHPLLAALLISNVACFAALLALYRLTARECSDAVARRTIVYLAVFPTAFFFLAPYSESLFLWLSVTAFLSARSDRWWLAGLAGAGAALTRSMGILIAPALLVMALERPGHGAPEPGAGALPAEPRRTPRAARVLASASVALGPILYFAWWQAAHGDLLAPLDAQQAWQREAAFPLTTLWRAAALALGIEPLGRATGYWLIDLLVVGVIVAAVVLGWRSLAPAYLTYAGLSLAVPLAYPFPPRPLLSMPRFVLVVFPAFWALADAAERRRLPHTLVIASFAAGLGLLTVLFATWWYIF